jgi:hypothetical protein
MYKIKLVEAQKEAQEILNYCVAKYSLEPLTIKVKTVQRGCAYYDTRFISIPLWAWDRGITYFYAYVLHEVSHFYNHDKIGTGGHGDLFKITEGMILKDFKLIPVYKKAYIKALLNDRGQVLYKDKERVSHE